MSTLDEFGVARSHSVRDDGLIAELEFTFETISNLQHFDSFNCNLQTSLEHTIRHFRALDSASLRQYGHLTAVS